MLRIQLGPRQIVNAIAALRDDPEQLVDARLRAVIDLACGSRSKATSKGREDQGAEGCGVVGIEGTVDEDIIRRQLRRRQELLLVPGVVNCAGGAARHRDRHPARLGCRGQNKSAGERTAHLHRPLWGALAGHGGRGACHARYMRLRMGFRKRSAARRCVPDAYRPKAPAISPRVFATPYSAMKLPMRGPWLDPSSVSYSALNQSRRFSKPLVLPIS